MNYELWGWKPSETFLMRLGDHEIRESGNMRICNDGWTNGWGGHHDWPISKWGGSIIGGGLL